MKASKIYQTLHEKWDLYIPFLERAYQLLRTRGHMIFIVSDAYNVAKYSRQSHEFFLRNARIDRIDFCTDIPLFEAGVNNTIIHFAKAELDARHKPLRVRRYGQLPSEFEQNVEVLPTTSQTKLGAATFHPEGQETIQAAGRFITLGTVCYISTGLRPWLASRYNGKGKFITEDLVQDHKDAVHPKTWVESKDIVRWSIRRVRYLEWGTRRAPEMFESQTFPQFYEAPQKLLTKDISNFGVEVGFDDQQRLPSHTAYCCVPWHYLKGTINSSISKTAKYRSQDVNGDREERETLSQQFHAKYLLAIMNSYFAKDWLIKRRRSKLHVYPDDWKQLPIAHLPMEQQEELVQMVDSILNEFRRYGYPLPPEAQQRVDELERQIDNKVTALYGT